MIEYKPEVQELNYLQQNLAVLRLDRIHPHFGGNKYFKLYYNLLRAKEQGHGTLLTFGGAHSNHIYATAAACREAGLRSVGVIRGEDATAKSSPTLVQAQAWGMELCFLSREEYLRKDDPATLKVLEERFGPFFLVPEGANNREGVKGCTEILTAELKEFEYVFCACGTAATYSGLLISASEQQKIIGISVLKGENTLIDEANRWNRQFGAPEIRKLEGDLLDHSTILDEYHFGGYAKHSAELLQYKTDFENWYGIDLDYVYTLKLFAAVFDLVEKLRFPAGARTLIVHSGGLQGNLAYEKRYALRPFL